MGRGLSKQQKQILATLRTKRVPNSDRGYFSTDEVVSELHPMYKLWLINVAQNPFAHGRQHSFDYNKWNKKRVSVYRALRSLARRELVVTHLLCNIRHWAVPERAPADYWSNDIPKYRRKAWGWGAFVRTLPENLHTKYKLGIADTQDIEKIRTLSKEYFESH